MKIDIDTELSGMIKRAAIAQGITPEKVVEDIKHYLQCLQKGVRPPKRPFPALPVLPPVPGAIEPKGRRRDPR